MNEFLERTIALLKEGTLPIMLPLILCAAGISLLIIERGIYFYGSLATWGLVWPPAARRAASTKRQLARSIDAYAASADERSRAEILDHCRRQRTPYTSFVARVVAEDGLPDSVRDLQLAEAARREESGILRGLEILSTLAKVAPLMGLFGTVTGMIQTFRVMMFASTSDPRALSSGISIALIATEVGLAVSLPGVIGSSWLHRRAKVLLEEIHLVSLRFRQRTDGDRETLAEAA